MHAIGPAAALECSLGLAELVPAAILVLNCSGPQTCLAIALTKAAQGVRCSSLWVGLRSFLVAAAYLSTPQTVVTGPAARTGSPVATGGQFDPIFLAQLPPQAFAAQFSGISLVLSNAKRPRSRVTDGPDAWYYAGSCTNCHDIANNLVSLIGILKQKYGHVDIGGPAVGAGLGVLFANTTVAVNRPDRLLAVALGASPWSSVQGRFGVAAGDPHGWYALLACAAGAREKTQHVHFLHKLHVGVSSEAFSAWDTKEEEDGFRDLHAAMPNRAEFVILPPHVLGTAGMKAAQGSWDVRADVQLLDLVSRALHAGGLVFAVMEVGQDCVVLHDRDKGIAERIYGPRQKAKLLLNWDVVHEFVPRMARAWGPCFSLPHVLVLRHKWERHPAALLSVRRIDVIPKVLYATHHWLHLHSVASGGAWAKEFYLRAGHGMGSLSENCNLDNYLGTELCTKKRGKVEFEHGFNFLLSSVKVLGVTRAISAVRLDVNGMMLNGAHRVAASLAMGIERIPVEPTLLPSDIDQSILLYHMNRLDSSALLMELARRLTHSRAEKRLHVALVWPQASVSEFLQVVEAEFAKIGHLFMPGWEVNLTATACTHLVRRFEADGDVRGVGKLCGSYGSGKLFMFETSLVGVPKVRTTIASMQARTRFGSRAIMYVSEPQIIEEAVAALLHPPTVAFFEATTDSAALPRLPASEVLRLLPDGACNHCILDAGAVMKAHGLGAAPDVIETICDGDIKVPLNASFRDHGQPPWLTMHGAESPADLVHDPSRFFLVDGWRFVAPQQLAVFKRSRYKELCKQPECGFASDLEDAIALEGLYRRKFV